MYSEAKSHLLMMLLMTLPGSVKLYYGDEIGLKDDQVRIHKFLDDQVLISIHNKYNNIERRSSQSYALVSCRRKRRNLRRTRNYKFQGIFLAMKRPYPVQKIISMLIALFVLFITGSANGQKCTTNGEQSCETACAGIQTIREYDIV